MVLTSERKQNNLNTVFDIAKLCLCTMIVCIHTNVMPSITFPWIRIAVPLFFLLSAYFLFQKINSANRSEHTGILTTFLKRNLTLYLFWFVVLFPVTLHYDRWFSGRSMVQGLMLMVKNFFFFELFRAGWFLMALMIGVVIVYYLSRFMSNRAILICTGFIYLLLCLRTAYSEILYQHATVVMTVFSKYEDIFSRGYLSFPCGLFWIAWGKWFAEHAFSWSPKFCILNILLSAVVLFIEYWNIYVYDGQKAHECYLALPLLCLSVFQTLRSIPAFAAPYSKTLRKISTIVYTSHWSIALLLEEYSETIGNSKEHILLFMITICISLLLSVLLITLQRKKWFQWLKIAF